MPRMLALQFCLLVLLCGSAFALSPAELDILRENSPEFSDAEQRLANVYGERLNAASGEARSALEAEQRAWLETGLEEDAARLRQEQKLSRTKAYVQAMENRTAALTSRSTGAAGDVLPQVQPAAAENMVEATGTGTGATKMEALQQAWLDAVRSGIGLFLTSKTVAVNDEVTEQIAMHSRGQVNSYEVLSERHEGDTWEITIRAKIDKDILEETAATTQSKTLDFNARDDVAKELSREDKHKSQADVLRASLGLFDFSKCFEYQNSHYKEQDSSGKTQYYIQHILKFDLEKFAAQERQLEKVISSISEAKQEVPLDIKFFKVCMELIKMKKYKPFVSQNRYDFITPYGWGPKMNPKGGMQPTILDYNSFRRPSVPDGYSMCFFKNVGAAVCYSFGKKLGVPIPVEYDVTFSAEVEDGTFGTLLAQTKGKIQYPFVLGGSSTAVFFMGPIMGLWDRTPRQFGPIIECVQRLDLTQEQLLTIKEIKGSYTLRQLK